MVSLSAAPRTLYDKLWDAHVVDGDESAALIYIDRHLVHEVYTHIHTDARAHAHAHPRTHTHARTHTHTHTRENTYFIAARGSH